MIFGRIFNIKLIEINMRFKNTFGIICVMGMMVLTACEGAESIQQNINNTENQPS